MILKWLIFLFIGLPIQSVMQAIYPIIYVVWSLFLHKESPVKLKPTHDFSLIPPAGTETYLNDSLLKNVDDHGAFSQYGFIQKEGLELLQQDGSFIRDRYADGTMNRQNVSGDAVVAWVFANQLADRKASDEIIKLVTDNYIKNLGTLSYDQYGQGYVSARCSNFGVNTANDADFLKLSQPAFGPQFYTTSAVLAMAYHLGFKYKFLFWAHWLVMGGWYWAFAPIIAPDNSLYYVRDITMKSLYVHLQVFGPQWWVTKPMVYITDKISTHENDLFYAMLGRDINQLPQVMNPFFSQREDASSSENDMSGRLSAYIPDAIRKIKRETRFK